MKPAPVGYVRPSSLEEACRALADDPEAKVLAGGQSLVPLLSMRLAAPSSLVDINALPGLAEVEVLDGTDRTDGGVRVGALVRHADLLAHDGAARAQPLLRMALSHVAHAPIRNRGTTVGSLVHADAAAEMPAVLALLGGSVEVLSTRGARTVAGADLVVGPLESSLAHDEIATSAWFPALAAGQGAGFAEISRRQGDYALCGVAALVRLVDGYVVEARAAYLAVDDTPTVVDLLPALADGTDGTDGAHLDAAADLALSALSPCGDIHATAQYRAHLARVLTIRVVREAVRHAGDRGEGSAT
ncbi:FAD binding domain-containing protein [Nocardioides sp. 31GB23]|uniref:FAD binding domain-containing protein n=1 Tax=Nocardioides sp. 31GB23 TaxID=3156065 RepID=UPI0032AFE03F